jgi:uncharacterized membrane protein
MESRRVENLADGVFAIAMTLLVLEVHVPELPDPVTGAALLGALKLMLPHLAGFGIGFVILGTLWLGHQNQFRFIQRVDRMLVWLNVFYLLCIAFLPFATAFIARYPLQPLALALYGVSLLLSGVILFAHWNHAVNHGLVADEVTPEVADLVRERMSMGMVVYLLATIVGAFLPKAGLVLLAFMPILYMLPGRVDPNLVEDASGTD